METFISGGAVTPAMLTLVGTGHVINIGSPVRAIVRARRPAVVALELDPPRFYALQHPEKRGKAPISYMVMAFIQKRLAEGAGGQPGDEMLAAADEGRRCGASIALVDKDAAATFAELKRRMPFKEKAKLFGALLGGLFMLDGRTVDDELERYNSDQATYLAQFGEEFPTIKRVLLDERNEHMARALRELDAKYGRVVAFVGDGHVPGMAALLADISPETFRLKELMRDGFEPGHGSRDGSEVTISFVVGGNGL